MGATDHRPASTPRSARAAARVWGALAALLLGGELAARVVLPPWPYYRAWNVAHEDSGPFAPADVPGPFFPLVRHEGRGYGDLAFVSGVPSLRVWRAETFTTDALGYRDPPGLEDGPWDVVLFGDSMMAGCGLEDEETFRARLAQELGASVYDASGGPAVRAMSDARWLRGPPRAFVLESVERYLVADQDTELLAALVPGSLPPSQPARGPSAPLARGRWSRAYSAATHYGTLLHASARYALFGELLARDCVLGTDGRTLFAGEELVHAALPLPALRLERIADALVQVRDRLAAHGIELVYLVVPDKATLERELVPEAYRRSMRPPGEALDALARALAARGVRSVDVLAAFRAAQREAPGEALFWRDDTHWTAHGVAVAARATAAALAGSPPPR